MIFSLIVIGFILAVGYIWASKGFFNALIQLAVVLVSGAIAFGTWEMVANMLFGMVDDAMMTDLVWGMSLLLPFALSLIILSVLAMTFIRANVKCDNLTNWIGGGVCALAAASISAGIMCLSVGQTKLGDDFLGYKNIEWDSNGSITAKSGLLLPVDKVVAGLYGFMSERALGTGTPLAKWRPHMTEYASALNLQPSEDVAVKYTTKPGDIKVIGRYTVAQDAPANDPAARAGALIGDTKSVIRLDGTQVGANDPSYIEGYLIGFGAGAKEKTGQVSIGPGQYMLVLRSYDDTESLALHPIAMVGQAKGDLPIFGRFRFDGKELFLGTAGGAADQAVLLEFLVPKDGYNWRPIALYAKGQRIAELEDSSTEPPTVTMQPKKYEDRGDVDRFVFGGEIVRDVRATQQQLTGSGITNPADALHASNMMGRVRLNKGNLRGLEINEKNEIIDGEGQFYPADLLERGAERSLEVSRFYPGDQSIIMQVEASRGTVLSLCEGDSDTADGPIVLEDSNGQRFPCIGIIYQDAKRVRVRFTPGAPVRNKADLKESISRNRDDQQVRLVFRVSANVLITKYAIGSKVIATFDPPVKAEGIGQTRR